MNLEETPIKFNKTYSFDTKILEKEGHTQYIEAKVRDFIISLLTKIGILPHDDINPYSLSLDYLAKLIPESEINFDIIYELLDASYFKAGAKLASKERAGFSKKINNLNFEYFKIIGKAVLNEKDIKRADYLSTQIRELNKLKYMRRQ